MLKKLVFPRLPMARKVTTFGALFCTVKCGVRFSPMVEGKYHHWLGGLANSQLNSPSLTHWFFSLYRVTHHTIFSMLSANRSLRSAVF
jgi:hypothetical protein